jgi:AraC-like DNA-binding protein
MEYQTLVIKGMVCGRCIMAVKEELKSVGFKPLKISLGQVSYISDKEQSLEQLEKKLLKLGFAIRQPKNATIATDVKAILNEIYSGNFDFPEMFRIPQFLSERLELDYLQIRKAFVNEEKKTIEQYAIECKINKVKELLVYSAFSVPEIAFRLNYSSVAHLSTQFKQHTGLTLSFFRDIRHQKSNSIFSMN